MHHKRHKSKNQRAGCLLCKPHKANGSKGRLKSQPIPVQRKLAGEKKDARS